MAIVSSKCFLAIIGAIFLVFSVEVVGKRRRFYAHVSDDLRHLAQTEIELVSQIQSFKESLSQGSTAPRPLLPILDAYLENFWDSTSRELDAINGTEHVEQTLQNPLAIFTVIYRFVHFLRSLNEYHDVEDGGFLTALKDEFGDDNISLRNDLVDAADAILQIQFMYNLTAADLASGNVYGILTGTTLKASHCHYIGLVAKRAKQYTQAIEWFLEAKRLARKHDSADIPTVNADLVETIKNHDNLLWLQKFRDPYFFMKPLKSLESLHHQRIPTVREIQQEKFAGRGTNCSFWNMNTWGLCSGQDLNTPETSSHLFCWHEFKVNKVFKLGPLKMEFLSRNPDIVQVHNAFSETEVAEASASNLFPWVTSETDSEIEKKLGMMTSLVTKGPRAADPTILVSHLPGGHSDISADTQGDSDNRGDWISTVLIYLNDVEKGGSTVFPGTFAAAAPRKGSAVFWFNTLSDGSADFSTAHEDCPVVWGQKLVAIKRIRLYDQFSARKCLLEPKERFQVPVNGKLPPVPNIFRRELIEDEEYENAKSLSVAAEAGKVYPPMHDHIRKYAQSPSTSLKALLQLDWEIYQNLKGIVSPKTLNDGHGDAELLIRMYLQDFNETVYKTLLLQTNETDIAEAVSNLSWNPLAVYRAFWRFENCIKKLLRLPPQDFGGELREIRNYIGKVYNENDGPLKRDLEDTISGLLITQFVYDLKSPDIAGGIIAGIDTGIVLSARQCIEIGSHAIVKNYYYQAVNWMETARVKIASENGTTAILKYAEQMLETSKIVHDRMLPVSETETGSTFYTTPISGLRNWTHVTTRKDILHSSHKLSHVSPAADINLVRVCQEKSHQTFRELSKLFCWREHQIHPYFMIGPLQVELLSMHPQTEVVVYHNILGKKLLEFLRNDTGREFLVSAVSQGGETNTRVRLSATSFLYGGDPKEVPRVLKLVSRATGLSTMRRALHIHSYEPGGHYAAHTDSGGFDDEGTLVRMATFMFYVTEPKSGGGSAFGQARIHIPMQEGSAVFWYSVLSSGDLDDQSYHGGCPVIFGDKRIATDFIRYVDQNHVQCHPDRTRKMEVLVNGRSKYGYV